VRDQHSLAEMLETVADLAEDTGARVVVADA